jgi:hypothetical protein
VVVYGSWIYLREIHRRSDLPRFGDLVRAWRPWERAFDGGLLALMAGSWLLPWAVTGKVAVGLFVFLGANLLLLAIVLPILSVQAARGNLPKGTYWDGKAFHYGGSGGDTQ